MDFHLKMNSIMRHLVIKTKLFSESCKFPAFILTTPLEIPSVRVGGRRKVLNIAFPTYLKPEP